MKRKFLLTIGLFITILCLSGCKGETYTVNYVLNDGINDEKNVSNYNEGDLPIILYNPSKENYEFIGWYLDEEFTKNSINEIATGQKGITLYAKWAINEATVSFVSNGGSLIDAITQGYNTMVNEPPAPTKVGYTFMGWHSDENLLSGYTFATMPTEDITVYAKWLVNESTISFVTHAFDALVLSITQAYNTAVTAPAEPTKVGYTFLGWYSDIELSLAYTFTTMPADDITLYAKWLVNQYAIEYVADDGTLLQTADYDYNADLSSIMTPSVPLRTGYTFKEWDKVVPTTMPASKVTIRATYLINQYKIEYVDDNGTVLQSTKYDYNSSLSRVMAPNITPRTGYNFTWDTLVPETMPASDITVTAIYTINQYTLIFNSNGGSIVSPITQNYNTPVLTPSDPRKAGYSFSGWYSDEALTVGYTFLTMPAESITLYAKWRASNNPTPPTNQTYTIFFISNGGSAVNSIIQNSQTTVIAPNNPTRDGYTFAGWYSDEALILRYTFTTMPDKNIILYAKWTVNSYTIIFNSNGGSVVNAIIADYNTSVAAPMAPTKLGYTFIGWYRDEALSLSYQFATMPAGNITLYGKWTINNYTIIFNSNDGSVVSPINGNYNTIVTAPVAPTRLGYTFEDWYLGEALSVRYIFTIMPAEDIVLYGKWTVNSYTIVFNSNSGSAVTSITQNYNTTVTEPVAPTRDGYTFGGWSSNETLFIAYEFTTMPAEDISLYARWFYSEVTPDRANEVMAWISNYLETEIGEEIDTSVELRANDPLCNLDITWESSDISSITNVGSYLNPKVDKYITLKYTINPTNLSPRSGYHKIKVLRDDSVIRVGAAIFANYTDYTVITPSATRCSVTVSSKDNTLGTINHDASHVYSYGEEATVSVTEIGKFLFWTENNVIVSQTQEYKFLVNTNHSLEAHFRPLDKSAVVFIDVNGKVVDIVLVEKGEYAATNKTLPSKMGFLFLGFDAIKAVDDVHYQYAVYGLNANQSLVKVKYGYFPEEENKYKYVPSGSRITVDCDDLGFSYWMINDDIVSYERNYSLSVFSQEVEIVAIITQQNERKFSTNLAEIIKMNDDLLILGGFSNPNALPVVDKGFIISFGAENSTKYIYNWTDSQQIHISQTSNDNEFALLYKVIGDEVVNVCVYVVTDNGTAQNPVYIYHYSSIKIYNRLSGN